MAKNPFNEFLKQDSNPQPGDGTGSLIRDAMVRNDQGICGIQNCGGKLSEGFRMHTAGKICIKCADRIDASVSDLSYEDRQILNLMEVLSKENKNE